MLDLGVLHSEKHERDTVSKRALSAFASVKGPSSNTCQGLERRLAVLYLLSSPADIHEMTSGRLAQENSVFNVRNLVETLKKESQADTGAVNRDFKASTLEHSTQPFINNDLSR
jgi:hypothetical protein